MRQFQLAAVTVLVFLSTTAFGQLTVQNPQDLKFSQPRAEFVLKAASNVVAREFRTDATKLMFPVLLVLGADQERYEADDVHQIYAVYLKEWDEARFASAVVMLTTRRMVTLRQQGMLKEVLRRVQALAPTSVTELASSTRR